MKRNRLNPSARWAATTLVLGTLAACGTDPSVTLTGPADAGPPVGTLPEAGAADAADAQPASTLGTYRITLTNTSQYQGYSFPVAASHKASFHLFQVGQKASTQVAAVAQNGNPVPAFKLLQGLVGTDVTDVYAHQFPVASSGNATAAWPSGLPAFDPANAMGPGLYPTTTAHTLASTITFDIKANPSDVVSILGMMMCTNDGLTGLDGVALPAAGTPVTYPLTAYDAGVELNSFYTPDIVEPCALMAPFSGGVPALSTTDGNRNSPPSGAVAELATDAAITAWTDGVIPDNSGQPDPTNFVPTGWGWSGAVGSVTIAKVAQ